MTVFFIGLGVGILVTAVIAFCLFLWWISKWEWPG